MLNLITVRNAQNILVEKKIIKMKYGNLPKYFDPTNLNNLFGYQFVIWNEFQRKFIPGSDDGFVRTPYKDHILKFPCNNNGKLDV